MAQYFECQHEQHKSTRLFWDPTEWVLCPLCTYMKDLDVQTRHAQDSHKRVEELERENQHLKMKYCPRDVDKLARKMCQDFGFDPDIRVVGPLPLQDGPDNLQDRIVKALEKWKRHWAGDAHDPSVTFLVNALLDFIQECPTHG